MNESALQRLILKKLKQHPSVLWSYRTITGQFGGYRMGEAGHPDITAVINDRGVLSLLFLEVKVGKGHLRYEQRRFFESMEGKPKALCRVINDLS